jgi:hypothetical protein
VGGASAFTAATACAFTGQMELSRTLRMTPRALADFAPIIAPRDEAFLKERLRT